MGKKHKKHHRHEKTDRRSSRSKKNDTEDYNEDDVEMDGDVDDRDIEDKEDERPLKLVLKVGGGSQDSDHIYTGDEAYHEKKHKHKKKKKKRDRSEKEKHKHSESKRAKRKRDDDDDDDDEDDDDEDEEDDDNEDGMPKERSSKKSSYQREPRSCTLRTESESSLPNCLDYLHNLLQKKDINGFFAYPVNDVIAPGYSSIISEPMDFSTIKVKIDDGDYRNIMEYKSDFKLMCENAMTYNRQETIYYRAAKKLLQSGIKLLSKEKLVQLRRNLSFMACLADGDLGLDASDPAPDLDISKYHKAVERDFRRKLKLKQSQSLSKFEAIPDILTPDEILEQAQAASKDAADKLTLRKPDTRFGFLRRQKDGSTTLDLVNPENDGILNDKERVVNMGTLVGKLSSGTGNLPGFKEDKRNQVKLVKYLNYGPFSSYAPIYDSGFANLDKEESDRLLSCYGNETCVNYASSLQAFVEDCGDNMVKMVDRMLDILTSGEHSKTKVAIDQKAEEKKKAEELAKQESEKSSKQAENIKTSSKLDFASLRSLSDIGIDTSFIDAYEMKNKASSPHQIQMKLDETSGLIKDLENIQNERLSRPQQGHIYNVQGPSPAELQIAEKVTNGLTALTKQVAPSEVVSTNGVRKALGITEDYNIDNNDESSCEEYENSKDDGDDDDNSPERNDGDEKENESIEDNSLDSSDEDSQNTDSKSPTVLDKSVAKEEDSDSDNEQDEDDDDDENRKHIRKEQEMDTC